MALESRRSCAVVSVTIIPFINQVAVPYEPVVIGHCQVQLRLIGGQICQVIHTWAATFRWPDELKNKKNPEQ